MRAKARCGKLRRVNILRLGTGAWLLWVALLFSAKVSAEVHAATPPQTAPQDFAAFVPGARELEGRIIAPCCWTQSIDIHGSEVSSALRTEIRSRLQKGESAADIERSLVDRYGAKVLAVPPGSRLGGAGILLALALSAGGIGAVVLLRRWQRRSRSDTPLNSDGKKSEPTGPDALDARLDAELDRLDRD
jgi:cytochrome c-type biogenesis protein CcmH